MLSRGGRMLVAMYLMQRKIDVIRTYQSSQCARNIDFRPSIATAGLAIDIDIHLF